MPGEIKNIIYEHWALDPSGQGAGVPLPAGQATDVGLLGTCKLIRDEAKHFYYSTNVLNFPSLVLLLRFLASRTQAHREMIKNVKVTYIQPVYAYDAFSMLATCTGLEALMIEMATCHYLNLNSPGVWPLRQIRGLRTLSFSGWRRAVTSECRATLQRELKRKKKSCVSGRQRLIFDRQYRERDSLRSREARKEACESRLASLRSSRRCVCT